jgi:hypothetical protein
LATSKLLCYTGCNFYFYSEEKGENHMLDFESQIETSYDHEGQLYQRIAVLENELATSRRELTELKQDLKAKDVRIKLLRKMIIQALVALIFAAVILLVVGSYLLFWL